MQQAYNADLEFSLKIRMLAALASLPPGDVPNGFDDVAAMLRQIILV